MRLQRIGVMSNDLPRAIDLAMESADHLRSKTEVFLEDQLLRKMAEKDPGVSSRYRVLEPGGAVDLVLVFGGDGTILRAVRSFGDRETPVFGVNMGRMGFLSQVEPRELRSSLKKLSEGRFELQRRMKIEVQLGAEKLGSALNELLVLGTRVGKVFRANIQIGSLGDLALEADGLVVATPTGSTGHSLSVGGPVVEGGLDALTLAPLGALKPARPVVVSADRGINIMPGEECTLATDGQVVATARQGMEIKVQRSETRAVFAVTDTNLFWRKLRQRIGG